MQLCLCICVVVSLLLTVTASPVEDLLEDMVSQDTDTDEQWSATYEAYEESLPQDYMQSMHHSIIFTCSFMILYCLFSLG